MDFGALLHVAKKNSESTKSAENAKYYSTKFAPPKKESKDKKLSDNIQRFLAKAEKEKRERLRIEKEKRDQLLASRDEKSKNKIKKMLKVIKSANKSVLDDAVDTEHTAVTRNGPEQPDADDYGYVSTEANAFYQKYIEKVKDVKEDKVFAPSRPASKTDLTSTKDRVKAAIEREIWEKSQPHTRVRTAPAKTPSAFMTTGSLKRKDLYDPEAEKEMEEQKKREEEQKKVKVKKPPPPALDFQALLKLAEKKQFEPLEIAVETKKEPERLLTKKEKKEYEERQRYLEEREQRKKAKELAAKAGPGPKVPPERQKMEPNGRIPKLNQTTPIAPKPSSSIKPVASSTSSPRPLETKPPTFKKPINPVSNLSSKSSSVKSSPSAHNGALKPSTNGASSRDKPTQKQTSVKGSLSSSSKTSSLPSTITSSVSSGSSGKASYNGPTRDFPPKDTKAKPGIASQKTRQFPPPDVRRTNRPPEKKPQPSKRRILEDDDEDEYDSELDDFIDDGPEEEDYSQHIKAIFGYDKSRYRDVDEDDDAMESSFAQQMREEYMSKKIGLMEDLEDMRQEAEDKKRKAMKRKKLH